MASPDQGDRLTPGAAALPAPDAQVVTARDGADDARVTYAGLRDRALKVSGLLANLGVAAGQRVATLAWNTQAHVESW